MSTSALSPANVPIVRGTNAIMLYLHARGFRLQHGIILLEMMSRESQSITDHEIFELLINGSEERLSSARPKSVGPWDLTKTHTLMAELVKKGAVKDCTRKCDDVEWIALTEDGAIDLLAMLASCMFSSADDRA